MILAFVYDVIQTAQSKIVFQETQKQIDIDLEKSGGIQKHLLPEKQPGRNHIILPEF